MLPFRAKVDMDEESFRAMLDDDGVLREGAIAIPRENAFTVFGQERDSRFDLAFLTRNAARFFDAKLGATTEKRYGARAPEIDAARIVLDASDSGGTRLVLARSSEREDQDAAESAESRAGYTGMSLLAQRCKTVWLVEANGDEDRAALTIAAIFATVVLGPILSPNGDALFGVKTARMKLERLAVQAPRR